MSEDMRTWHGRFINGRPYRPVQSPTTRAYSGKDINENFKAVESRTFEFDPLADNEDLVRLKNEQGHTLLHVAAASGHWKLVTDLIEKGANTGAQDNGGWSALHHATYMSECEVVKSLLAKDAAVNLADNQGRTPLHIAAQGVRKVHLVIMSLLCRQGTGLDLRDRFGRTALYYAVQNSNLKMASCLLRRKADVRTQDDKGNSLYHICKTATMYDLLNRYYSDFWHGKNTANVEGQTPLHTAVKNENLYMIEDMCRRGASPVQNDNNDVSPLRLACKLDRKEAMRVLQLCT